MFHLGRPNPYLKILDETEKTLQGKNTLAYFAAALQSKKVHC